MWTTVLVLAVAVNFEPTRIGLVPILLARPRPLAQLLAYLTGTLTVSLGFGLLILFVFQRNPFGVDMSDAGKAQVGIGIFALGMAAVLSARSLHNRRTARRAGLGTQPTDIGSADANNVTSAAQPRDPGRLTESVRTLLRRGRSPWFAGLVGVALGLPSIDYLALLIIIATSTAAPLEQASALIVFLLIGSSVVMAPLVGYLIAPARTLELLGRFGAWSRSRSLIEYAALLAVIGVLLIAVGMSRV